MEKVYIHIARTSSQGWIPSVDIFETDDGFVVKAELPRLELDKNQGQDTIQTAGFFAICKTLLLTRPMKKSATLDRPRLPMTIVP